MGTVLLQRNAMHRSCQVHCARGGALLEAEWFDLAGGYQPLRPMCLPVPLAGI